MLCEFVFLNGQWPASSLLWFPKRHVYTHTSIVELAIQGIRQRIAAVAAAVGLLKLFYPSLVSEIKLM